MKVRCCVGALLLVAAFAACKSATSAPATEAEKNAIQERMTQYYQQALSLPPDVTLKFSNIAAAAVPGLFAATLEATKDGKTETVPLLISRDLHYVVAGHLVDITVDPFKSTREKINLADQPVRGNPNAAVTIVEYSDFQCPYCGRAYTTVETEVRKQYGDQVRLVYKNFPLDIHPWAASAALAGACARRQSPDAFWKLYDFFFQNQESITPENLKEKVEGLIKDAGGDVTTFDTCFSTQAALDLVKADQDEAAALGVNSTPTFFINGRKVEGAMPFENFKTVIDAALKAPAA